MFAMSLVSSWKSFFAFVVLVMISNLRGPAASTSVRYRQFEDAGGVVFFPCELLDL